MTSAHHEGQWHVEVDAAACTGSGLCVGCAPNHFEIGVDYRSHAKRAVVAADDDIADAAECCPMEAIHVVSLDSGRRLYPPEDEWSPAGSVTAGRGGAHR